MNSNQVLKLNLKVTISRYNSESCYNSGKQLQFVKISRYNSENKTYLLVLKLVVASTTEKKLQRESVCGKQHHYKENDNKTYVSLIRNKVEIVHEFHTSIFSWNVVL